MPKTLAEKRKRVKELLAKKKARVLKMKQAAFQKNRQEKSRKPRGPNKNMA